MQVTNRAAVGSGVDGMKDHLESARRVSWIKGFGAVCLIFPSYTITEINTLTGNTAVLVKKHSFCCSKKRFSYTYMHLFFFTIMALFFFKAGAQ